MRFQAGLLAGLVALVACGGDNAAPDKSRIQKGEEEGRQINGQVYSVAFTPESTFVGVAGATIMVLQTSADSGDSSLVHPDSGNTRPLSGRFMFGDSGWIDTIPGDTISQPPGDTIPSDTLPQPPGDTIPSDTIPQPPHNGCGAQSQQVATAVSDADGHFTITGLGAGTYDLIVVPPAGFGGGIYCGADLRSNHSVEVHVFVPPRPDSASHRLD